MLYAAEEFPELKELISRKFGSDGDVQRACELVLSGDGLPRTKQLATFHAQVSDTPTVASQPCSQPCRRGPE